MSDVQESIAIEKIQRNPHKPNWLTTNMIVACALSVIEKMIPSYIGKLKSIQSPRCENIS